MSTRRKSSDSSRREPSSTEARQRAWLAEARQALREGELARARRLARQVVRAGGPLAAAAERLLARIDEQRATTERNTGRTKKAKKTTKAKKRVAKRAGKRAAKKTSGGPAKARKKARRGRAKRAAIPTMGFEEEIGLGFSGLIVESHVDELFFLGDADIEGDVDSDDEVDLSLGRVPDVVVGAVPPSVSASERPSAPPVRRTPHMDISTGETPLALGQQFEVHVFADEAAPRSGEESEPLVVRGAPGQTRFEIEVWLAGTAHFSIGEPRVARLILESGQARTSTASFQVRVRDDVGDISNAALFAYFTYDGRPCGKVSRALALQAAPPAPEGIRPTPSLQVSPNDAPADIVVQIIDPRRERTHLQCKVSSRLLGAGEQPEPEEWNLAQDSGQLVLEYMKQFLDKDDGRRLRSLRGAGVALFEAAPAAFRRTFWTLVDRGTPPASILVVSEEPFIPWELMIPARRLNGSRQQWDVPLGVRLNIGRWLHEGHLSPPAKVPLSDGYIVAPDYPGPSPKALLHAAAETALVMNTVRGDRIHPADVTTLSQHFEREARSLLHLVCHGSASSKIGIQEIYLEGGIATLSSLEVSQLNELEQAFQKKRTLVFLNACEVGRPAVSLTGIGGFAKELIELGAAAVIAPLWSVRDSIAFKVAEEFYGALQSNRADSFAAILGRVRARAYATGGEDTYAAYCFYGDPLATAN